MLCLQVNEELEEEGPETAKMMRHKHSTKLQYYDLSIRSNKTARFSDILDKLIRRKKVTERDMAHEKGNTLFKMNIHNIYRNKLYVLLDCKFHIYLVLSNNDIHL